MNTNTRVIVCGSRHWIWYEPVKIRLAKLLDEYPKPILIVHGGASGADSLAEVAARALAMKTQIFKPDWERYGRGAGFLRNIEMLDAGASLVIAFWDGKSRGTLDTIRKAGARGIPLEIYEPPS